MFGSATRTPFGSNTSFGFASGNQPNPFASAPQIFSTASTFGTTAPPFGQTSTNMFGSTQQPAPLFGSTSAPSFGTTNQNAFGSTGLFGQQNQTQQSTGIFGGPSTSFGQANKPSGFSFPFGQAPQQQPTQTNVFQNPANTSIFGSSGFGSQPAQSGTVIKFVPVTGSDSMQKSGNTTMINTKHHSITCMKEYESKSFEELRFEDYAVNRKGSQQSTGFGAPAQPFGAAPATTSLFGQPDNKPAFGSTNGFGQASTFGVPSQASTSQGIFGKPATAFGSTVTTTSSFGFPTSSSNIFGSTPAKPFSSQPSQTLFPSTSQQAGGFGTPFFGQSTNQQPTFPTQTGSYTFGQPTASTQSSLFQPPKSSTGFGAIFSGNQATTSTAFGQPSTTGFSGFNSFAKPAQNTFGQATQPQTGFGTGISMPTNNLFSGMGNKPTFGTGTTSGGLFSSTGLQMNNPPFSLQLQPVSQPIVLSAQSQTLEMRGMFNLSDPYGLSPHLDGLTACKSDSTHYVTNPKELDDVIKKQDFGPASSQGTKKLKLNMPNSAMNKLFEEAYDVDDLVMKNFGIRRNPKRLVIKTPVKKPEPIIVYHNGKIVDSNTSTSGNLQLPSAFQTQSSGDTGGGFNNPTTTNQDKSESGKINNSINTSVTELKLPERINSTDLEASASVTSPDDGNKGSPPVPIEDVEVEQPAATTPKGMDICGIISTRPEYYTIPPLNEIAKYKNPDGSCFIKGFTIGRIGYGNVYFPDVMDVSNLNIDDLVHFRFREIIIYPDDDSKPPVGEGLNRRAQVTLDRVYPRKQDNENEFDTEPEEIIRRHYTETLKFACERANTSFVDYRPETGSWVFNVVHFSKYTLTATEEKICETRSNQCGDGHFRDVLHTKSKESLELLNYNEPMDLGQGDVGRGMGGYTITSVTDPIVDLNISTSNCFTMDQSGSNVLLMRSLFYEDNESIHKSIVDGEIDEAISISDRIILEENYSDETIRKKYESIRDIYSLSNELCRVPVKESLVPTKCMIDAVIMKGKSFKVGWGQGFTIATIFSEGVEGVYHIANTLETYVYTPTEVAIVDVSQSCLLKTDEDPFLSQLPRFMDIVLQNSQCVNEVIKSPKKQIPRWEVNAGSELTEKMCDLWNVRGKKNEDNVKLQYYKNIWDLCLSFWGPMTGQHLPHIIRKQRFNEWLENVTKKLMDGHISCSEYPPLKKMLIYLSGHRIKEAAKLAASSNMPHLSLLISQLNTNNLTQYCMRSQIKEWERSGAIEFITEDLLKLYIICCGTLYYQDLIVCEGLDWLRALGMHLWYQTSATDSLKCCIDIYENAFIGENPCAAKPYPIFGSAGYTWDIMYYLMKLYCDERLDLDIVLSPATHTDNLVDYRLSWFLMQTLQSLKVGVISKNGVNKIITMFATQLEQLGYFKWAIFVVLFLNDVRMRENLIFSILDRNLSDSVFDRNIEKELVVDLKIPLDWIHKVKALKTKQLQRYWECYRHLAYSQLWNDYHEMFIHNVLPVIVCNQHFDLLKDILTEMSMAQTEILRWKVCGGFLLEFTEMWSEIQNKLNSVDSYEYNRMYHMINDFAWKIGNYPLTDLSQNMVASVISQKTADLFYNFLKVLPVEKRTYINKTSNVLNHLVMPKDFRYENLSNVLVSYYDNSNKDIVFIIIDTNCVDIVNAL